MFFFLFKNSTLRVTNVLYFFRSVLRESIENIQEENARCQEGADTQRYNNCIALLYNLEFIWHLTEVLYIDATPGLLPSYI